MITLQAAAAGPVPRVTRLDGGLCRFVTWPALWDETVQLNAAGRVET